MAIMLTIDEMTEALMRTASTPEQADVYKRMTEDYARTLATLLIGRVDGITCTMSNVMFVAADAPDGGTYAGFHPVDGDYTKPIPEALEGLDDYGWE